MTRIPVACTLSDAQMRERERTVLAAFGAHVFGVEERSDGYDVQMAASEEAMTAAAALIAVERRCCPFLRFALSIEPGSETATLSLTGPEGTREFLSRWVTPWAGANR
jgi:hypothetical protein